MRQAQDSTSGELSLDAAEVRAAAEEFVGRNGPGWSADWEVAEESVSHVAGDAVTLLRWRPTEAGHPGVREVTVEVDRRTGAVTYLSAARGTAGTAGFVVTAEEAVAAARAAIGDDHGTATATPDTWDISRWTVTVDRGLTGRPGAETPDVERVTVDARSGAVLSRTKS
ncbi:PepSY domain-containing protein [Streptomyces canus]|uniref:PepSY domain-containing protein n=1 Tax=Streptomyces canus TaxID=58343 RepID=A0AAW8FX97_9ACTN|nr:PepSY domain-containing protein [Streptomyces canus]MDQ0757666.1 hypothetical protein [Streptomyces canus]MDQ0913600.1 hypothetical protein [Streptomyces canus]